MRTIVTFFFIVSGALLFGQDTLDLSDCHQRATVNAPRINDVELIRQMGELKIENVETAWLPSVNMNGKISYQSDVVSIVLEDAPFPVNFPEVPYDQYGLNVDISQTLYDGGIIKKKKELEQARIAVDIQQVEVDVFGIKQRVNQFYFAILVLQENRKNLGIHMDNLLNRKEVMQSAVENGTLLESDIKVLEVELLKVKQSMIEIESRKRSFLETLNILCGSQFTPESYLTLPRLDMEDLQPGIRPEYNLFDLKQASMEAGKELISRRRMPLVYAFGQTGYGKPGYNMLSGEWDYYYMVGAGLKWNIWDWNSSSRDRQVIEQQQEMLNNRRLSFDREINTLSVQELAKMEQFRLTMELEEEVLELQRDISENAAVKLSNGTITATEYVTELNRESLARIKLATHQIQLQQTIANYLNIHGNL